MREKHTDIGESKARRIRYAASEMQGNSFSLLFESESSCLGWRMTMEDAHIFKCDLEGKDIHIFGVFDGHGGQHIAVYTISIVFV
jgi:hypothetical protein